jgi:ABC-type dipeptide/oligopeptide/nickel transport system ATPase component
MLHVELSADYPGKNNVLRNVTFDMSRGEVLGLVGQSGSGKSTMALALMRLLHFRGGLVRGRIVFEGQDLAALPEKLIRAWRGSKIAYVPQSPATSLNPALRIRTLISEAWRAHSSLPITQQSMLDLLGQVSLPAQAEFLNLRSGELSIGQGQRLLIALALLHRPRLIVADEPTSALDLITQQEILRLFRQISDESGTAILFISHDLTSVAQICDRVAILYEGEIIEIGATQNVFESPQHPYARRLIAAIPRLTPRPQPDLVRA